MNNTTLKQNLMDLCQAFVDRRMVAIQNTIREIQESLTSETKSSAGDKHETGRAMLQLEREKAGQQLAEIEKLKQLLSKINILRPLKFVSIGSVVFTTQANYFIAISAGELKIQDQSFYAISANTPIGQLLMGKHPDEIIQFRDTTFKIIAVN